MEVLERRPLRGPRALVDQPTVYEVEFVDGGVYVGFARTRLQPPVKLLREFGDPVAVNAVGLNVEAGRDATLQYALMLMNDGRRVLGGGRVATARRAVRLLGRRTSLDVLVNEVQLRSGDARPGAWRVYRLSHPAHGQRTWSAQRGLLNSLGTDAQVGAEVFKALHEDPEGWSAEILGEYPDIGAARRAARAACGLTSGKNGVRVRCLNTGDEFSSLREAAAWAGTDSAGVCTAAGHGGRAGRTPGGEPARWAYADRAVDERTAVYTFINADGCVEVAAGHRPPVGAEVLHRVDAGDAEAVLMNEAARLLRMGTELGNRTVCRFTVERLKRLVAAHPEYGGAQLLSALRQEKVDRGHGRRVGVYILTWRGQGYVVRSAEAPRRDRVRLTRIGWLDVVWKDVQVERFAECSADEADDQVLRACLRLIVDGQAVVNARCGHGLTPGQITTVLHAVGDDVEVAERELLNTSWRACAVLDEVDAPVRVVVCRGPWALAVDPVPGQSVRVLAECATRVRAMSTANAYAAEHRLPPLSRRCSPRTVVVAKGLPRHSVVTVYLGDGQLFITRGGGQVPMDQAMVNAHGGVAHVEHEVCADVRAAKFKWVELCTRAVLNGCVLANDQQRTWLATLRLMLDLGVASTVDGVLEELRIDETDDVFRVYEVKHTSGVVYIGSTGGALVQRFKEHSVADSLLGKRIRALGLSGWSMRELSRHSSRAEALEAEADETEHRQALGERLLNRHAGNRHTPEERRRCGRFLAKGHPVRGRRSPVMCTTTGDVFPSISAAARWAGVQPGAVRDALTSTSRASGRTPDGRRATWRRMGEQGLIK